MILCETAREHASFIHFPRAAVCRDTASFPAPRRHPRTAHRSPGKAAGACSAQGTCTPARAAGLLPTPSPRPAMCQLISLLCCPSQRLYLCHGSPLALSLRALLRCKRSETQQFWVHCVESSHCQCSRDVGVPASQSASLKLAPLSSSLDLGTLWCALVLEVFFSRIQCEQSRAATHSSP